MTDEKIINTTNAVFDAVSNQSSEAATSKVLFKEEYLKKVETYSEKNDWE